MKHLFVDKYGALHWIWWGVGAILFIPLVTLFIGIVLSPFMIVSCHDIGVQMGLATKWSCWHGCYINWHGQWLTEEMFKAVAILK